MRKLLGFSIRLTSQRNEWAVKWCTFARSGITHVAATVDVQSHKFVPHWVVSATVDVQRRHTRDALTLRILCHCRLCNSRCSETVDGGVGGKWSWNVCILTWRNRVWFLSYVQWGSSLTLGPSYWLIKEAIKGPIKGMVTPEALLFDAAENWLLQSFSIPFGCVRPLVTY